MAFRINNGQVYSLSAVYAKQFITRETNSTVEFWLRCNLESGLRFLFSDAQTIAAIAESIIGQFGTDLRLKEYKETNHEYLG